MLSSGVEPRGLQGAALGNVGADCDDLVMYHVSQIMPDLPHAPEDEVTNQQLRCSEFRGAKVSSPMSQRLNALIFICGHERIECSLDLRRTT